MDAIMKPLSFNYTVHSMSLELKLEVLHSMSIELELASLRHTHLYNYVASILRRNEGPVINNISASRIGVRQEQMRGWSVLLRGFCKV